MLDKAGSLPNGRRSENEPLTAAPDQILLRSSATSQQTPRHSNTLVKLVVHDPTHLGLQMLLQHRRT